MTRSARPPQAPLVAAVITGLLIGMTGVVGGAPYGGWTLALAYTAISVSSLLVVLLRFGLLPALVATFVAGMLSSTVATLDFSAWYANRALLPSAIFLALLAWGASSALAGRTVFGDMLRDEKAR